MRLLQLDVPGERLAAQRQFYADLLGLPVEASETGLEVTLGWSVLRFTPTPRPSGHREHLAFSLPMARFVAARDWLASLLPLRRDASGVSDFPSASWGSRAVYFDDPDGNILELIAYPKWPVRTTGAFSGAELLGLAEFGMAVRDVPATCAALAPLSEDPPATPDRSFMWVGGPEGRLIVVRQGRLWFPDTDIPATPAPFRLHLDTPDGVQVLTADDLPG